MNTEATRVLLVEDNPADARLLREALSDVGETQIELVRAGRLDEALRRLGDEEFKVILLDLSLPDGEGIEMVERLQGQASALPIVVLTGLDDDQTAVAAVRAGAQDYLVKGQIDGRLLVRAIRYAIERKHAQLQTQRNLARITALREIGVATASTLDLSAVLTILLEKIAALLPDTALGVRLIDQNGELMPAACRNLDEEEWRDDGGGISGRGLSALVLAMNSPLAIPRIESDPRTRRPEFFCKHGLISYLGLPLMAKGEAMGVLSVYTKYELDFSDDEISFLSTLAGQAAMAIHNSQLYEQTKRQASELEKANRLQADFSAMIAHDLRSPLANVIAVAEMLKEGLFGATNDDQQKWLSRMQNNARNLIDLVSDFLDVSKLEAGRIDLAKENIDLKALIDQVVGNYLAVGKEKQIELRTRLDSSLPAVAADPRRLDQVLSNLLSNALKFTNEGGIIEVGARLPNDAEIEVYVKDTGVGILKNEIGSLFEKYRQVKSGKSSEHKGTGLGLVICKMIVEGHGGSIRIESVEGRGSTFYFTIPNKSKSDAPSLTPA